jgi:hypothetical protein
MWRGASVILTILPRRQAVDLNMPRWLYNQQ